MFYLIMLSAIYLHNKYMTAIIHIHCSGYLILLCHDDLQMIMFIIQYHMNLMKTIVRDKCYDLVLFFNSQYYMSFYGLDLNSLHLEKERKT